MAKGWSLTKRTILACQNLTTLIETFVIAEKGLQSEVAVEIKNDTLADQVVNNPSP